MQREVEEFRVTVWNSHRIRAQKDTLMADGISDHMFEFPEQYGMERKGVVLSNFTLITCNTMNHLYVV